ncbi:hypothetical protein, partial [Bifidobacterium breve]|uniref:hypothetical protein n=1 Tax=Bifidobacterium breve TaxID=1685 RepID=UPI002164147C
HTFDRFGIGDRRAAVLLHDESHCCPLFFSWEYLPIILRKRNDYKGAAFAKRTIAGIWTP